MKLYILNETNEDNKSLSVSVKEINNTNKGISGKSLWESLKYILSKIKDIAIRLAKTLKLAEIGEAILSMIRSIPIIGRLIPNQRDKEKETKSIIGTISLGNGVTKCMNILQYITSSTWNLFPLPSSFKENFIKPIFDYNDRQSFLQALYKMMLDANIEAKYANAYLMVLALKIPLYNMLYVFKPFWSNSKVNKTNDDKLHPFTSGDPNTNPETGLNETEERLQKKVQKFIQIKKLAEMNENDNNLELNSKLTRAIIIESLVGIIVPIILPSLKFFSICFGKEGGLYDFGSSLITCLLCLYYYYFLVTSIILSSLAIENEESFHPSKKEESNKVSNNKLAEDGTIDFHQS